MLSNFGREPTHYRAENNSIYSSRLSLPGGFVRNERVAGLTFARAENQASGTRGNDDYAGPEGKPLASLSLNAQLRVPDLYGVFLAMRDGHNEGQHTQQQQYHADDIKNFHIRISTTSTLEV